MNDRNRQTRRRQIKFVRLPAWRLQKGRSPRKTCNELDWLESTTIKRMPPAHRAARFSRGEDCAVWPSLPKSALIHPR